MLYKQALGSFMSLVEKNLHRFLFGQCIFKAKEKEKKITSKYLFPLTQVKTQPENLNNESRIRTRVTVQRLFGILKRRFPILSLGIRVSHAI